MSLEILQRDREGIILLDLKGASQLVLKLPFSGP
jgi:hypothetical protein